MITAAITGVVSFVLGTIFGSLVLNKAKSEAELVKAHVTTEVGKVREELRRLLAKA